MNVKFTGSGHYIQDRIETAEQVAQKINKNADWIISRTGVQNRHISDIDVDPALPIIKSLQS